VVIDFSTPKGLEDVLDVCIRKNLPLVLATTGLSEEMRNFVRVTAQRVPILQSGNFSLGIALLQQLVKQTVKALGPEFDIEIVEKHHNQKLDAPSGTAKMLYDTALEASSVSLEAVYDRHSRSQVRGNEIGISSIRGGSIVGEHNVIFAGNDEVITLTHEAGSRKVFAVGALRAAAFLLGKEPGEYTIPDLIGEAMV
jgi:4-hydroxy-tetrahydrodipicolinate reductase